MSSKKRVTRNSSTRSSSRNQKTNIIAPDEQEKSDVDISDLMSTEQLNVVKKHFSSGGSKSVVIIPNNLPAASQPSTSGSPVILAIPEATASQGSIAKANIVISLPEAPAKVMDSTRSSSKRGRPNKFVELENGEIVRQSSVPSKKPDDKKNESAKGSVHKRRLEKEASAAETSTPVRRTSRASAGRKQKYADNLSEEEIEMEIEQTDQGVTDALGLNNIPVENMEIPVSPIPIKRKRGRPKKNLDDDNDDDDEDYTSDTSTPRIRVKKTGLFQNEEESLDNSKVDCLSEIICGACSTQMTRKEYGIHRLKVHHGLTWIEGEDEPITFYDSSMPHLNYLGSLIREAFVKYGKGSAGRKSALACQNCKKSCGSYMGYLSHFTFCQISAEEREKRMYQCPICDRKVTPASRYYHDNMHKAPLEVEAEPEPPEFVNVDIPKRAAAVKARTFMQNLGEEPSTPNDGPSAEFHTIGIERRVGIMWKRRAWIREIEENGCIQCRYVGCHHTSSDAAEFEKHIMDDCPYKAVTFVCSQCELKCQTEELVLAHYKENHKPVMEVLEQEEDAITQEDLQYLTNHTRPFPSKPSRHRLSVPADPENGLNVYQGLNLGCFAAERLARVKSPFRSTLIWTQEFINSNYSTELLFPKLFDVVEFSTLKDPDGFLPLVKTSVLFTSSKASKHKINKTFVENSEWKSLECMEGDVVNQVPILFAGGPILSMAWCPTPHTSPRRNQYLAVSCHRSMDCKLGFQGILPQNSLIQIWSFGLLCNKTPVPSAPSLFCALGHEWGVVRQLEWCPSGCWEPETNKLGLLGAACADGTIRIIPISNDVPKLPYLKAEASLTLVPHTNPERLNQCVSLHWYKGKGHQVVAGGYADGLLCFWNLAAESPLLKITNNKVLPYLKFYAHQGPVVSIKINPHMRPKFVVTGGLVDKSLTYWNLDELGETSITHHNPKKGRVTGLDWMLCWPTQLAAYEEQGLGTVAVTPRNFTGNCNLLPQNSSASDIDKSDWLNCVAHSTGAGEVSVFICSQMTIGMENEKNLKERRALLTRTTVTKPILRKNEDGSISSDDPSDLFISNYAEASERGLVFSDNILDADNKWPVGTEKAQSVEKMDTCCSANYPLISVSKLAWNSNISSFGWIAVGYQCGLVRLLRVTSKISDEILENPASKFRYY